LVISNKYKPAPVTPDFASMIMLFNLISLACKAKSGIENTNKLNKILTHNFHITNIADYICTQFNCRDELKSMFIELADTIIKDK
jgi:hypothetical protein